MSEWKESKISDFCNITRGGSPRPIHDYLSDTGTPWVKISDATASGNRYIERTEEFIKPEGETKSRVVYPGDFIVSNSATPGLPRFMKIRACIHDGWLLIRDIQNVDELFMYYLVLTQREALLAKGNGSIFTNLKTEILKEHKVLLPPLPEQKAIAGVLSSLDDKIDLLHRQNKTLEAMAEALFRQWFVEPCKDGLPEGWREGKLVEEFDITMGQSPVGTSFNENGIGIPMFQGNADFGFRFPVERIYTTEPTRYAEPLNTLVSVRAPVGEQNMALMRCCIGRGLAAFNYIYNRDFYTYTYFKVRSLMTDIKQFNDEGTVFGSIGKSDFEALKTIIPTRSLIVDFERIARPINDKVIKNSAQIRILESYRDMLLPRFISGEIRLN